MDDLLLRAAAELFARHAGGAAVRAILAGGPAEALWRPVAEAGFLDALCPEAAGGAGLSPADALAVVLQAGRHAVPLPLAETMLARAALAASGETPPEGPIALAEPMGPGAARLPAGQPADWAIVPGTDGALLVWLADATEDADAGSPLGRVVRWPSQAARPAPAADYRMAGAWAEVGMMAGALDRMLEMTVAHATARQQFGRPVAAFQAVQQQISVLTEDVFAARMAAQLASVPGGAGLAGLDRARVAAAKVRVGEAAVRAAAIAHAVHGAMGITAELDLHLLTARLQSGRMRFGGETFWAGWLGRAVLAAGAPDTLSFVRTRLGPVPSPAEQPA